MQRTPVKAVTCRAALADEARLLADAIQQETPESVLVEGLETYARSPVVTHEALENISILRDLLKYMGHQDDDGALKRAADVTDTACQTIDSPEQHAQDAIDEAIELLAAEEYEKMLERFTSPDELTVMKASGRMTVVLEQLESGWGRVLMAKLQAARAGPPIVNDDGTISFFIPGLEGLLGQPLTMVERKGRWYFRAPEDVGGPTEGGEKQRV